MYFNTLRLSVRHDKGDAIRALLPVVAALNADRYERNAQLAFVEDGVRVAGGDGLDDIQAPGWPRLRELVDDLGGRSIVAFACADCATAAGVSVDGSPVPNLEWLPSEDVRIPVHSCPKRPSRERPLVSVGEQHKQQIAFDEIVGRTTVGADRGE
jgi:predicted peroxiredoxin